MEKGDTDLATFLKSRDNGDLLTDKMIAFYWAEMLTCVKVIHDEGADLILI
jgi:hypothetical protein